MAFKIKNVAVPAGSTVGLFSATGASVASSSISVKSNNASFYFVAASDGSGDTYPIDGQTFTSSTEVYVKNSGSYDSSVTVRISS